MKVRPRMMGQSFLWVRQWCTVCSWNSKSRASLASWLDRMMPEMKRSSAAPSTKQQTLSVGKRGTSPVWNYSLSTGTIKPTPNTARMAAKMPKNINGR